MKVLSPTEVQNVKDAELLKTVSRTKATREALADAQRELENAKAVFEFTLAEQRVRWIREEQDHVARIEPLKKEIEALEAQRAEQVIPIEVLEKKAYSLHEEAEEALAKAEEKRKANDDLGELLEEKIDVVTEKEAELAEREAKIIVKEKAIASQVEMVKNLSADLTKKMAENLNNIE